MYWDHLPTIDATRVRLRRITAEDTDAFYAVYSNPEVMRYWSTPPLIDRAASAELIETIHADWQRRLILKWGIALQSDNQLIGSLTLFNLDFTHRRAEIGYALGRDHWGQGYMNEALMAVLRFAFEVLELHRIEADIDPRNTASIKTVERLGFQREGYLRERWQVNGEIQDAFFYGLLQQEWVGNRTGSPLMQQSDPRSHTK
ncbi:MAG: [ribosomal protein S5]-alanine N-acetyltransferase [Blastocatellia bacterium]|jgi:RimJ/RimL family protein N-acetyltransferase|nr:[ribosomal protein S5]-alanine N-acetyltransferase [Blastocatellia bacterium]